MKTWNTPEFKELSINATAGGDEVNLIIDGDAVYDETTHKWWAPVGKDENYHH